MSSMEGMRKARVLPLPVLAAARISLEKFRRAKDVIDQAKNNITQFISPVGLILGCHLAAFGSPG